ncbi:MAG: hypothetical protein FP825_16750 [Hyphomonas sp.]|uniref:hypothetical protein n=1 Tax=Hyphomonas sp. TaxID=87 RepID=UPI00185D795B|nr:hypothetical protein [Hyphomonas sp.]MBU3922258.1 hypothetical protein [Alphaproteobacteria bacterium]MBA3070120.1 hypothetical protein [Hyphomonas sp.]MBU4060304.1 hypothetical protein [Alphaproteobacteria bacterium]MBU4162972.1 hypothetical protein [Alphaproteobacteria bacterium]MBU4567457.1 hypothetical protein [Alphaproteobacteria bacterium]
MTRYASILVAALVLTACAGTPRTTTAETAQATAAAIDSVPAGGLPPQRLEPGQCGLFLWGMSAPRKFVFFSEATSGTALALLDDMPQKLRMTSAAGDVFGQFLTDMEFQDAATGRSVHILINPGEPLEGGQRVDTGNLLVRSADGWETILPVTGVRACMPG